MSTGPGNYDKECTIVRELTQAHAVVLMVVGRTKGNGVFCAEHDCCIRQRSAHAAAAHG